MNIKYKMTDDLTELTATVSTVAAFDGRSFDIYINGDLTISLTTDGKLHRYVLDSNNPMARDEDGRILEC